MSWKILINDGMEASGIEALRANGFIVDNNKISQDDLATSLVNYDGIIIRSATKVTKDIIDVCPNLKFIARGGVGLDNVAVEHAKEKGIIVINTPAASSRSVAELAMAHIFAITRRLEKSNRKLVDGNSFASLKKEFADCSELQSKTLFLIGYGRIGKELAKMALGCDMNVIVHDPYISNATIEFKINQQIIQLALNMVSMDEGFAKADYISIHTPYTGKALLSTHEFGKMKKGVFVVNTSRGENIDEEALLTAIENGIVQAAGLDVFQDEPNIANGFIGHDRISISPHIGASTKEAQERIAVELVNQIISCYKEKKQ